MWNNSDYSIVEYMFACMSTKYVVHFTRSSRMFYSSDLSIKSWKEILKDLKIVFWEPTTVYVCLPSASNGGSLVFFVFANIIDLKPKSTQRSPYTMYRLHSRWPYTVFTKVPLSFGAMSSPAVSTRHWLRFAEDSRRQRKTGIQGYWLISVTEAEGSRTIRNL